VWEKNWAKVKEKRKKEVKAGDKYWRDQKRGKGTGGTRGRYE